MYKLTIVGLGPGHRNYLTKQAEKSLKEATCVYVRTVKHPIVKRLIDEGITFKSYDALYEQGDSFEAVYQSIVTDLIMNLEHHHVVYAVPGNPFVAEKTVSKLIEMIADESLEIIHGTSFLDAIITRLRLDPVMGLRVVDTLDLKKASTSNREVLICIQCYNQMIAGDLKVWLSGMYCDDHPICIAKNIGIPEIEEIIDMPLYHLDRYEKFDHLTSVIVYKNTETARSRLDDLKNIMTTLRSDNGCPWDRVQTHLTLKPYVLEEAYEVAEVIENDDIFGLEEELGDLLLQVVFHAQIASENGDFQLTDVLDGICHKLISRHPHVFSNTIIDSANEVNKNWEDIKKRENNHRTTSDIIKKYSKALPALFRTYKVIDKAAKAGFDWQNIAQALEKYDEENMELKKAIETENRSNIEEELGDVFFSLVCVARKLGVDSEHALHKAIDKFAIRFRRLEQKMLQDRCKMSEMDVFELVKAWKSIKNKKK